MFAVFAFKITVSIIFGWLVRTVLLFNRFLFRNLPLDLKCYWTFRETRLCGSLNCFILPGKDEDELMIHIFIKIKFL